MTIQVDVFLRKEYDLTERYLVEELPEDWEDLEDEDRHKWLNENATFDDQFDEEPGDVTVFEIEWKEDEE